MTLPVPGTPELGVAVAPPGSRLAGLAGRPIHPTQLYSILWNVAVGLLIAGLLLGGAEVSIVSGAYFIGSGLGRFVEEAYRGEPQTPVLWGLRLYQWLAVASIVGGALVTTAATSPAEPPRASFANLLSGIAFGLVAAAAYGVDFPRSSARFARLT